MRKLHMATKFLIVAYIYLIHLRNNYVNCSSHITHALTNFTISFFNETVTFPGKWSFVPHSTPRTKTFLRVATWGAFLPAEPKVTQNCLKWIHPVSEIFPCSEWGGGAFLPAKPKDTRNCLKCFSAQFIVIIIFIIDSYYSDLSYSKSITKSFAM